MQDAEEVLPPPGEVTTKTEEGSAVKRISTDNERQDRMLMDHHGGFSLEDNEQEETDLVLETDNGNAQPRRQWSRRLPMAAKQGVDSEAGIIQPSNSP